MSEGLTSLLLVRSVEFLVPSQKMGLLLKWLPCVVEVIFVLTNVVHA